MNRAEVANNPLYSTWLAGRAFCVYTCPRYSYTERRRLRRPTRPSPALLKFLAPLERKAHTLSQNLVTILYICNHNNKYNVYIIYSKLRIIIKQKFYFIIIAHFWVITKLIWCIILYIYVEHKAGQSSSLLSVLMANYKVCPCVCVCIQL